MLINKNYFMKSHKEVVLKIDIFESNKNLENHENRNRA